LIEAADMDATTFLAFAMACAPQVHPATARAIVGVESSFNPYAIGMVGGTLVHQPRTRAEAIATAKVLQSSGWNFSAGLAQINVRNFQRLGLSLESAFDPCSNLRAMQAVLSECFDRARARFVSSSTALRDALSCYYSGNFVTGHREGYVRRVVRAATASRVQEPAAPHISEEQP
jgi:type IV secretion system protein VirB1